MDLEKTKLYSYIRGEQKECPLDEFSKIIEDFLSAFLNRHGNLRLIFLIDEIECTLNKDWTETLFNHLRALIYEGFLRVE